MTDEKEPAQHVYICWEGGCTDTAWHKSTTAKQAALKHARYKRGQMTGPTYFVAVNASNPADSFGGVFEVDVQLQE
jgi:hypothetical protein